MEMLEKEENESVFNEMNSFQENPQTEKPPVKNQSKLKYFLFSPVRILKIALMLFFGPILLLAACTYFLLFEKFNKTKIIVDYMTGNIYKAHWFHYIALIFCIYSLFAIVKLLIYFS